MTAPLLYCQRGLKTSQVAEDLYTKGWISYPRTETDSFDKGIDLKRLIEKQVQDHAWGPHAQGYVLVKGLLDQKQRLINSTVC